MKNGRKNAVFPVIHYPQKKKKGYQLRQFFVMFASMKLTPKCYSPQSILELRRKHSREKLTMVHMLLSATCVRAYFHVEQSVWIKQRVPIFGSINQYYWLTWEFSDEWGDVWLPVSRAVRTGGALSDSVLFNTVWEGAITNWEIRYNKTACNSRWAGFGYLLLVPGFLCWIQDSGSSFWSLKSTCLFYPSRCL